jgi:hypothetical protein
MNAFLWGISTLFAMQYNPATTFIARLLDNEVVQIANGYFYYTPDLVDFLS